MLNIKRLQDYGRIDELSANQNSNYIEITRYSGAGLYHTYKISVYNFLRSMGERLTGTKLQDEVEYRQTNVMLGTVTYSATQMIDDNYIIADGGYYTDNKFSKFHNVTYVRKMTDFVDMLEEYSKNGCSSVIPSDIGGFQNYTLKSENAGKYVCDFKNRVVRVPNLNTLYISSTGDLSTIGKRDYASMPNIEGFFSSCYHGFDQSAKKYEKVIQNIMGQTKGAFSINSGKVDKNYVRADLDLSNQSEKFAWTTDIGQLIDFDASRMSNVYGRDDNEVIPDSVKFIPYILISNIFTLKREAAMSGD